MNTETLELMLRTELPAARRGNHQAYGRIVRACQNTITAIALAITRDVQASEDIAQEAFLTAWQRLDRLRNSASFLPWLRQITRNLARDHLRANRNKPLSGEGADLAIQMAADPSPTPSERLLQTEEEIVATEIISALPEESRETLLLYYREDQSSQQVATLLGLSDAAVRKRLSRARQTVRGELLQRFGDFARASAPSAAFVSALLGMLGVTAPPTAAAAILGTGGTVAGKGFLKLLGASAGVIAFGLVAAISSVWFGIRKPLQAPLDREERNALLRYGVFNTLLIVTFMAGITWLSGVPGWIPHVSLILGYMFGILWSCSRWLPKILERRKQRDLLLDPIGTTKKIQRERFWKIVGLVAGISMASAALVYGMVASGRWSF